LHKSTQRFLLRTTRLYRTVSDAESEWPTEHRRTTKT
jgi:hypothetical protein